MTATNRDPEPTGGWLQYRFAGWVLVLYGMIMLIAILIIVPLLPRYHTQPYHQHPVPLTSEEPFHPAPSVLRPLRAQLPDLQSPK